MDIKYLPGSHHYRRMDNKEDRGPGKRGAGDHRPTCYALAMVHPLRNPEKQNVQLEAEGRSVLPATIGKALELQAGDPLGVELEDAGTRLMSARGIARQARGLCRTTTPGLDLADELIAERRKEPELE